MVQPTININLPLDFEVLNTLLQGTRYEGKIEVTHWRVSWLCPAGATTNIPLYLPSGMICTRRKGLLLSDYYDPSVVANILVDRKVITPFGMPMVCSCEFDFGEGYVKREVVEINTVNGTATDARLTLDMTCNMMEKSFFESFYQPLIELVYKTLEEVVKPAPMPPAE